jgi:hypothetical protein
MSSDLDEVGQLAVRGSVHLAGALAQFRRDVDQVERLENVGLIAAADVAGDGPNRPTRIHSA